MANRGEISQAEVKKWESETHGSLPERVKPKKKSSGGHRYSKKKR
jgi:hypothetical protein